MFQGILGVDVILARACNRPSKFVGLDVLYGYVYQATRVWIRTIFGILGLDQGGIYGFLQEPSFLGFIGNDDSVLPVEVVLRKVFCS